MTHGPRRILVVDDESIIVRFLESLLELGSDAYLVATARTGAEAITKAKALKPHLVILDINLPGSNGFEVCETICKEPSCRHTVVLAMTAEVSPQRVRKIEAAGAFECIRKPFSLPEFLEKVKRYSDDGLAREQVVHSEPPTE